MTAYSQTKGALHFDPERPLPAALARKLIKARIAETATRRQGRTSKKRHAKRVVKSPFRRWIVLVW